MRVRLTWERKDGAVSPLGPLETGLNLVGSGPDNDIIVATRTVSKCHLALRLGTDGTLEARDLASKNGLYVNGTRSVRCPLRDGDRLHLGSEEILVQWVDDDDTEMAIPGKGLEPRAPSGGRSTTAARSEELAVETWLRALVSMSVALGDTARPSLELALGRLADEMGATGAAVVDRTSASVVAVVGGTDGMDEAIRRAEGSLRGADGRAIVGLEDGAVAGAGLWGDVVLLVFGAGDRVAPALPLIAHAARLVASTVPDRAVVPPLSEPELSFPPGYVPSPEPAMQSLYDQLRSLVRGTVPVLVRGETGVGKECIAQILHASSDRSAGSFVAINCAAVPADLLEAELFGVAEGAATGVKARIGHVRGADGGTLFLDEIGDMPEALQAKLLRVLQSGQVHPIGARSPAAVDVRIVSATNNAAPRAGLRPDLYYRLAGHEIEVPPLRSRPGDVRALTTAFLRKETLQLGRSITGLSVAALKALCGHPWHGNVRELQNTVSRLVRSCPNGGVIDRRAVVRHLAAGDVPAEHEPPDGGSLFLRPEVEKLERRLIRCALSRSYGNKAAAARLLGISRQGLGKKIRHLGIDRDSEL